MAPAKRGVLGFKETLRSTDKMAVIPPLPYLAMANPREPSVSSEVHLAPVLYRPLR